MGATGEHHCSLDVSDTLPDSTEEWQEMVVRFCDAFDGMGYCERMVTFSNIFKYANTLCVYSKR